MEIEKYLQIINVFENLKNNTRHCYTSSGRKESVAEHSHRLAIMAYFVKDEFPDIDIQKVILMCLFHDLGEAFTGDIPCFEKTESHEKTEAKNVKCFLESLPDFYRKELIPLFTEMETLETSEAKLYKALDNMEAVIQHNESDISTWLPLEYDLNRTYAFEDAKLSPCLMALRQEILRETEEKITVHAAE